MSGKQFKGQLSSSIRNYIAKVVFTYTQTMGLADRQELEELADQVISRMERDMISEEKAKVNRVAPTLPGMEDLVAPLAVPPPSKDQIETV
ncbi:MAG: hypothetical protein PHG36_09050, partial [Dehalococcoidia bacterium]|nr:hypothetical protein [Dehalococcoidia bacterium]